MVICTWILVSWSRVTVTKGTLWIIRQSFSWNTGNSDSTVAHMFSFPLTFFHIICVFFCSSDEDAPTVQVPLSLCTRFSRCPVTCLALPDPICGSDGRLYLNKCHMVKDNCGKKIVTQVPRKLCLQDEYVLWTVLILVYFLHHFVNLCTFCNIHCSLAVKIFYCNTKVNGSIFISSLCINNTHTKVSCALTVDVLNSRFVYGSVAQCGVNTGSLSQSCLSPFQLSF